MKMVGNNRETTEWMIDLLRHAGKMALDGRADAVVRQKGPWDLVTEVDTAIEVWLVDEIRNATPDCRILAEESCSGGEAIGEGRWWVLDPLDGTVNFASGLPFFAVSLALIENGVPVVGVVFDPVHDEVFEARKGGGARLNGTKLVMAGDSPGVPMVGLSSGFLVEHIGPSGEKIGERILREFPKIRNLGSQALHLCYVACGRFAAALSVEAKVWDDAAGALVAIEAGARYTGLNGLPVFPVETAGECLRSLSAHDCEYERILAILSEEHEKLEGSE